MPCAADPQWEVFIFQNPIQNPSYWKSLRSHYNPKLKPIQNPTQIQIAQSQIRNPKSEDKCDELRQMGESVQPATWQSWHVQLPILPAGEMADAKQLSRWTDGEGGPVLSDGKK